MQRLTLFPSHGEVAGSNPSGIMWVDLYFCEYLDVQIQEWGCAGSPLLAKIFFLKKINKKIHNFPVVMFRTLYIPSVCK